MTTRFTWPWCFAVLTLSAFASYSPARGDSSHAVLSVVVGQSVRATDISLTDLRRLFMGYDVTTSAGDKLMAFNHPPTHSARQTFDRVILQMTPEQMGQYWVAERIRGQLRPPRVVPSEALLAKVVAKIEGAISYLPANQVPSDLKVLSVDRKKPSDPAYPVAW